MLLEVNCSLQHFMDFLQEAEDIGLKPDFDAHGADENSSFSLVGQKPQILIRSGSSTIGEE